MSKILIEESALDSIKRMAQELQDQRGELLSVCKSLVEYDESNQDNFVALILIRAELLEQCRAAIARCQESTKVME